MDPILKDCEIEVFRTTWRDGTAESGVQLTHLPTGLVAEARNGPTQDEERDRALAILRTKLDKHGA